MRKNTVIFFIVLFVSLCVSVTLYGKSKSGKLLIDHKQGQISLQFGNETVRYSQDIDYKDKNVFEIKYQEKIVIKIAHPNPLIYEYKWKGITKEKTADYLAAVDLASNLNEIISPFKKEFVDNKIKENDNFLKSFSSISGRGSEEQTKRIQTNNKNYLTFSQKILDLKISSLVDNMKKAIDCTQAISSLKNRSVGSDEEIEKAKTEVASWDINDLESKIKENYAQIDKFQTDFITKYQVPDSSRIINFGADWNTDALDLQLILFAKDQQINIMKIIDSLKIFADTYKKINIEIELDKIEYSSSENIVGSLEISKVDQLGDQQKTGKIEIVFEPQTPVHFSMKPALLFSFIKGDDSKYIGWVTPIMFSIRPNKWDNPIFGSEFQLGLFPAVDKLGIFVGMAIKIYNKIVIGSGAAYQKINEDDYKFGWYLNIAYDLK